MRQPTLYLSHGAPPLADDQLWRAQLHGWATTLSTKQPVRNILMVSAHWEVAPATLSATAAPVPLLYDFYGFAARYYQVRYNPPLAPDLAIQVQTLLEAARLPVGHNQERGLDHGAYVPLAEMFPGADVPVVQLSLPTLEPPALLDLGRRLAPLREQGTLIIGSGFTTHNLSWLAPSDGPDRPVPAPSQDFDQWAQHAVSTGQVDSLLDFAHAAPAAALAHPRTEHWAPLYVSLGAALETNDECGACTIDGFWYGLSKRSWQFG